MSKWWEQHYSLWDDFNQLSCSCSGWISQEVWTTGAFQACGEERYHECSLCRHHQIPVYKNMQKKDCNRRTSSWQHRTSSLLLPQRSSWYDTHYSQHNYFELHNDSVTDGSHRMAPPFKPIIWHLLHRYILITYGMAWHAFSPTLQNLSIGMMVYILWHHLSLQ